MRLSSSALVLLLCLVGCGAGDDRDRSDAAPTPSLTLAVAPLQLERDSSVAWLLAVSNHTDEVVELTCPTGQQGDVVLTRSGAVRYRWSDGRFFTQSVRSVRVPPDGFTVELHEDSLDVVPGDYVLEASITCDGPAPAAVTAQARVAP